MITRQSIATLLTTTAIAYSICSPAQAASLVGVSPASLREAVSGERERGPRDTHGRSPGTEGGDTAER